MVKYSKKKFHEIDLFDKARGSFLLPGIFESVWPDVISRICFLSFNIFMTFFKSQKDDFLLLIFQATYVKIVVKME